MIAESANDCRGRVPPPQGFTCPLFYRYQIPGAATRLRMRVLLHVTAGTPTTSILRQRLTYHATTTNGPRPHLSRTLTNRHPAGKQEQIQALLLPVPRMMPAFAAAQVAGSARPNSKALAAGAGIAVALGAAGVVLYARALKAQTAAATAATAAATGDAEIAQNTVVSKQTEETGGSKQPCEGCDCGLNGGAEPPGPLEGTMHAYERHIIICRLVVVVNVRSCVLWR